MGILHASDPHFTLLTLDGVSKEVYVKDLEKFKPHTISTSTNFTIKSDFTGVKFSDFLDFFHIKDGALRAFAWDDYSFTLDISELLKYGAILAYKRNGEYMPISDLGPFAVIFPRDEYHELDNLSVNAKTVWQINLLKVIPND